MNIKFPEETLCSSAETRPPVRDPVPLLEPKADVHRSDSSQMGFLYHTREFQSSMKPAMLGQNTYCHAFVNQVKFLHGSSSRKRTG